MTQLTIDQALAERLGACREAFLRLDAGEEAPFVRLPEGEIVPLSLKPEKGLRAAGALLSYALLGEERADAADEISHLSQFSPDRPLRKACDMARMMLEEDAAFTQAGLYAALRGALSYLPEGSGKGPLSGLIRKGEQQAPARKDIALTARFAWAEDAPIAYFDLPDGVEEAAVDGKAYTRAQCRRGVCLAPGKKEIPVEWEGGGAVLVPHDPLAGLRFQAGFRFGRLFLAAHLVPGLLWGKLTPCIRVRGPRNQKTPEMKIVSSCGQVQETPCALPQGYGFLRCPPLDYKADRLLEIYAPGLRYLDITGEG